MINLKDVAFSYFKRRTLLRIGLLLVILVLWAFSELSDFYVIPSHDLNYKAVNEVQSRYDGGDFSFAVVGDPKNSPVFDNVVQRMNKDDQLLFVILGGDLVLYPTVETYRAFLEQRAELHAPSMALPGNHDVAFKNHYFYHTIFGRFYYSFAIGNSQFILLDNSNEQRIGEEQFAWLEKQLTAGQVYKNRFVFMHVPLWDPRGTNEFGVRFSHSMGDTDEARRLEDLFRKNNVTVLFEGHIHAYYDIQDEGLHQIISGGGGSALSGTDPKHAFYHYIKVTVSEDQVTTEVVRLEQEKSAQSFGQYVRKGKLYLVTFLKLYKLQLILGLFVFLLVFDGILEYLYQRRLLASSK